MTDIPFLVYDYRTYFLEISAESALCPDSARRLSSAPPAAPHQAVAPAPT
jgi:hypothetical protein